MLTAFSIRAMEKFTKNIERSSSLENLTESLSVEEKKEITKIYIECNSALEVASILIPTTKERLLEKREDLKKFCMGRIANSSRRDSKGNT